MQAMLALGSNIGDRASALRKAREHLVAHGVRALAASAIFESEAQGFPGAAPYLNAVLQVEVDLDPWQLLALAKKVERRLGRRGNNARNAPRVIDIDLLACLGVWITSPSLTLPHPRIEGRDFVTTPLASLKDAERFFPAGLPRGRGHALRQVTGSDWSLAHEAF